MGIADALLKLTGIEKRLSIADIDNILDWGWSGLPTWSGSRISEQNSLELPAVWSCVKVISEFLASMPMYMYRRLDENSKEIARDHYLFSVLADQPNPNMGAFEFFELGTAHLGTWGNFYSIIEWDKAQRVKALYPLDPSRMDTSRPGGVNQPNLYKYKLQNGTHQELRTRDVFHVRGLGYDGIKGYTPIGMMRQSLGLTSATQEFGAKLFGQGTRPSGLLETPQKLSQPEKENLQESFGKKYAGLDGAHRVILLEQGVTFRPVSVNPDDAQFLETRKFQRSEIAAMYRVPLHMIGDLDRATFSNIEQQSIDFISYTMMPWLVRWEQAVSRQLLSDAGRLSYFPKFNIRAQMRGDSAARAAYYKEALSWGWLELNEVREEEDRNPYPDKKGSISYRPLNMQVVDAKGKVIAAPVPAGGAKPPTPDVQDDPQAQKEKPSV